MREKARQDKDEAIQKLQEQLKKIKEADEETPWLEVIVGAGHHSRERQKIAPRVRYNLKNIFKVVLLLILFNNTFYYMVSKVFPGN